MKMMNKYVEATYNQISNSLEMYYKSGVFRSVKPLRHEKTENTETLTWEDHQSGRHNSGDSFNTLQQYLKIYETGAYHAIFNDGSIVRCYYKFQKNILLEQSLLFWPSPMNISEEVIEELGISDALILMLNSIDQNNKDFRMRSPMRYDFSSVNNVSGHSATHVHIQHADCRLKAENPICFNTFIEFVLKNFYPTIDFPIKRIQHISYSHRASKNDDKIVISL